MPRFARKEMPRKKRIMIWAGATLGLLAIIFGIFMYERSWLPVSVVELVGDVPDSPAQIQRMCRANYERFAEISSQHPDCVFVWNRESRLYVIRKDAFEDKKSNVDTGFESVRYYNTKGVKYRGYIIDPVTPPNEIDTITIEKPGKLTYDSVGMTIREGMRRGEIKYKDAAYLWKTGSDEVLVVKKSAIGDPKVDSVHFTDDGGETALYYILDTQLKIKKK